MVLQLHAVTDEMRMVRRTDLRLLLPACTGRRRMD